MYFKEEEIKPLINEIANRFPGSEMLLEVMGPAIVGKSKKHDSLSKIDNAPEFKWGIKNSKDIMNWNPKIEILNEWSYFDYQKERAGFTGYIVRLPFIRKLIDPRIVHLRFARTDENKT
jgi:O-methyltransferase involved in polyketide biosynthesis